jgi:predicted glycogen debranching enzyme
MSMPLTFIDFGRDVCGNYTIASRKEWLVTNGIGGFASGTVAGALTRRYHGLLLAALQPPLGRTLLVSKFNETVAYGNQKNPLYCDLIGENNPHPRGYLHLERFFLEGTTPVWVYACADALIEKRVWMSPGANTTYVQYRYARPDYSGRSNNTDISSLSVNLFIDILVNYRDYHGKTRFYRSDELEVVSRGDGVQVIPHQPGGIPFSIISQSARMTLINDWYCNHYLPVEAERGESEIEDHLIAGNFQAALLPGESLTIVATTESNPELDGETALNARRAYEAGLLFAAGVPAKIDDHTPYLSMRNSPAYRQLILAADQFIVQRPSPSEPQGSSIIAGYPWFSDWGRDTMISLPGLTLVTGRPETARKILRTYATYIDQGMLPNRFPDAGEEPEYNTIDATLWYFEALQQYLKATQDIALLEELFPHLESIIDWHLRGTRYGIRVDPEDNLLAGGAFGVQLTWMDARVDDWVVTPRMGKAVEINALWYNALCLMEQFCNRLGLPGEIYATQARKTRTGFARFWDEDLGYLIDVLDSPHGNDRALRPNQLLAVSLSHSALPFDQQKAVVDSCSRFLLTSHGMRSLAPFEKAYLGHYTGTRYKRDAAYHQGTVWGWLIGPFIGAYLKIYREPQHAERFLAPLIRHLQDHGLGSISEIFDGDAPHTPDGCIAQAWSVAEVLRSLALIQTDL